jgi:hypothetical protein
MNEQKFRIIFKGEILPNANLEEVKKKLPLFIRLMLARSSLSFQVKDSFLKKISAWTLPGNTPRNLRKK